MVQLIAAFIVLALVYFILLFAGVRLLAAFNLVPQSWFQKSSATSVLPVEATLRSSSMIAFSPANLTSTPSFEAFFLRNQVNLLNLRYHADLLTKSEFATQTKKSDLALVFLLSGAPLLGQISNYGSPKADVAASIRFNAVRQLPLVSSYSSLRTISGDLAWRS